MGKIFCGSDGDDGEQALRAAIEPAEGVADKQQSGEVRHCLQGRTAKRLAWERGEGLPLQEYCVWTFSQIEDYARDWSTCEAFTRSIVTEDCPFLI